MVGWMDGSPCELMVFGRPEQIFNEEKLSKRFSNGFPTRMNLELVVCFGVPKESIQLFVFIVDEFVERFLNSLK